MQYCYKKGPAGDYGFRVVDVGYELQAGEVLFDHIATDEELAAHYQTFTADQARLDTIAQIVALEASVTERMRQEALAGSANTFFSGPYSGKTALQAITEIRASIDTLRASLS